ncbi:hypothetical protein [Chitinophaga flava]|uniref:Uncharacterized protein n=1 Tax=Chitinophaga flava TaxID=2259036 RepID=A0A365Y3B7_9BACT|nr:hypothetical protein [Chitinophaga flava]RBL92464.1 hypothetical protein DF182_07745 [Chitinophaga flava]
MTTKIRMFILAVVLCLPFVSKAQFTPTASTTLTVNLSALSGIELNAAGLNPTLNYLASSDYTNGVTVSQTAALSAFSTSPYSITIHASGQLVNTTNSSNTIPVGDVTVTPSLAASNSAITITPQAIPVSAGSALKLIASTAGTILQNFNLAYSTVGAPTTDFINKLTGAYTTTIVYAITNP